VASAIRFPLRYPQLGIRILNVSLGVVASDPDGADVEAAVAEVVESGVTVFAAAGNTPGASPLPPGSSKDAITVGGLNDRNTRDEGDNSLFPSSYGSPHAGITKPDLVAPAIWLPAPMLPGTLVAREAGPLFQLLSILEEASAEHGFSESNHASTPEERASVAVLIDAVERRIAQGKYISPDYQHVDGTSFAAPITASVAAQMLEADPSLTPAQIREGLITTAQRLASYPANRQGAGLLRPRLAVEWAARRKGSR
jgi:serine protease AprX